MLRDQIVFEWVATRYHRFSTIDSIVRSEGRLAMLDATRSPRELEKFSVWVFEGSEMFLSRRRLPWAVLAVFAVRDLYSILAMRVRSELLDHSDSVEELFQRELLQGADLLVSRVWRRDVAEDLSTLSILRSADVPLAIERSTLSDRGDILSIDV